MSPPAEGRKKSEGRRRVGGGEEERKEKRISTSESETIRSLNRIGRPAAPSAGFEYLEILIISEVRKDWEMKREALL